MALINPSIVWTDEQGLAQLTSFRPSFTNWTPDTIDVGDSQVPIGNSRTFFFAYRQDQIASFEIPNIANTETPIALRLKSWLVRGGVITINTRDDHDRVYSAYLAPGTVPEFTFSDSTELEYTLKLVVVNSVPVEMIYTPFPQNRSGVIFLSPSPASLAIGGTVVVTATLLDAGLHPVVGATIAAVSSNTAKFTVSPASGTSDALGNVAFTLTGVAASAAIPLVVTSGTLSASDEITVDGLGSVDFYNTVIGHFTSAHIALPNGSVLPAGAPPAELTIEYWVKMLASVAGVSGFPLACGTGSSFSIQHLPSNGLIKLYTDYASTFTPSIGTWVHVAFVRSTAGSYKRWLINGVQHDNNSDSTIGTVLSSTQRFIGGDGVGDVLAGRMCELRVWNVARSNADILANYNKRLTGSESGLVGYWKMNEGAGATVYDSTSAGANGVMSDSTGNVQGNDSPSWSTDSPSLV